INKVFQIPELVESIQSHLTFTELFPLTRVSKLLRNKILLYIYKRELSTKVSYNNNDGKLSESFVIWLENHGKHLLNLAMYLPCTQVFELVYEYCINLQHLGYSSYRVSR